MQGSWKAWSLPDLGAGSISGKVRSFRASEQLMSHWQGRSEGVILLPSGAGQETSSTRIDPFQDLIHGSFPTGGFLKYGCSMKGYSIGRLLFDRLSNRSGIKQKLG